MLQFASLLAAVNQDGGALEFASDELRADAAIVLAAVNQDGCALGYASSELCNDAGIVLAAVNQAGSALKYASPELRADAAIVLAAVNQDGRALGSASSELRADATIVLAAVNQNGIALAYASDALRADAIVAVAAATNNYRAFKFILGDLRFDAGIIGVTSAQNPLGITVIPLCMLSLAMCCRAVVSYGKCLVKSLVRTVVYVFHELVNMTISDWLAAAIINYASINTFMLVSIHHGIGQLGCGSFAFNWAVAEYLGVPINVPRALIITTSNFLKQHDEIKLPVYDVVEFTINRVTQTLNS